MKLGRLRKTDRLFTELMRKRQDFTCQKCGLKYVFDGVAVRSLQNLGVSHYFSRRHENTRYDPDNCILLCNLPCHQLWGHGEGRAEYKEFMIKKLGEDGLLLLEYKSQQYRKRDDKLTEFVLQEMLKEGKC